MKKLIALNMIVLILSTVFYSPFAYAQDVSRSIYDEGFLGEAITVNVKDIEPKVLTSDIIEDDRAHINVFLEGSTLGSFLGQTEPAVEPLYGVPIIKNVQILQAQSHPAIAFFRHIIPPSGRYTLNDLGTLQIFLNRIPKEHDVPEEITADFIARISFDTIRTLDFGEQDLILDVRPNQDEWLQDSLKDRVVFDNKYGFWANNGYLRASQISNRRATITVYDGSLRPIGSQVVNIGSTSKAFTLFDSPGLLRNTFRVKLNNVFDDDIRYAMLDITLNGNPLGTRFVAEKQSIYPNSEWKLLRVIDDHSIVIEKENDQTLIENEVSELTDKKFQILSFPKDVCKLELSEKAKTHCQSIKEFEELQDKFGEEKDVIEEQFTYNILSDYYIALNYQSIIGELIDESARNSAYTLAVNYMQKAKDAGYPFAIQAYEDLINQKRPISIKPKIVQGSNNEFIEIKYLGEYQPSKINNQELKELNTITLEYQVGDILVRISGFAEGDDIFTNLNLRDKTKETPGYTENYIKGWPRFLTFLRLRDIKDEDLEDQQDRIKYTWVIDDILDDNIVFKRQVIGGFALDSNTFNLKETIQLGKSKVIDGTNVKVVSLGQQKIAHLTIIPGEGEQTYSESEFTVIIPIEKRPIDFTPEQIEKQIIKTEDLIEDLNKIIDDLESLITSWRALCLSVFAFITIKNLFFGINAQARNVVMHEDFKEGKGAIAYCTDHSLEYGDFNKCMFENSKEIEDRINNVNKAIDSANKQLEKIDKLQSKEEYSQASSSLAEDLTPEQIETLRQHQELSIESMRNLLVDKELAKSSYQSQIESLKEKFNGYNDIRTAFDDVIDPSTGKPKVDADEARLRSYNQAVALYQAEILLPEDQRIVTISDESTLSEKIQQRETQIKKDILLDNVIRKPIVVPGEQNTAIIYENGQEKQITKFHEHALGKLYIDENNQLYLVDKDTLDATSISGIPAIQYNLDNTPYIVPMPKAYCNVPGVSNVESLYVVYDHKNSRKIGTQIFSAWDDGVVSYHKDIGDDKLVYDKNIIDNNRILQGCTDRLYSEAFQPVTQSKRVRISGKDYIADYAAAKIKQDQSQAQCYEVMSVDECKLLFNICDPVMCPTSRFNLAGRWQVDDVVQTGIIGSLVLGIHNWGDDQIIPPICLPGILAGLRNIRSVLENYSQCLSTSLVEDRSVGICDKIRSVFMCEILWKEGLAILKIKGNIIDLFSRTLGTVSGGGEYLAFQENLKNVENSVKFFTKDYAESVFSAYTSRSTLDIGGDICKAAVFGKVPGLGNLIGQITTPEDPPQFTALLNVDPSYSPTQKESQYEIFYHVYAGRKPLTSYEQSIRYSVYLIDDYGRAFYVTERCGGKNSRLVNGAASTQNIDCLAPNGFNKVCVQIDNKPAQCGFGKVSTNFLVKYISDNLLEKERQKQITKYEQCQPDDPRYSSSLASTLSGELGLSYTGIQRTCSIVNPSLTNIRGNWAQIGSCGSLGGQNYGLCWLNLDTLSYNDLEKQQDVLNEIRRQGYILEGQNINKIEENALENALQKTSNLNQKSLADSTLDQCKMAENYEVLKNNFLSLNKENPEFANYMFLKAVALYYAAKKGGCSEYSFDSAINFGSEVGSEVCTSDLSKAELGKLIFTSEGCKTITGINSNPDSKTIIFIIFRENNKVNHAINYNNNLIVCNMDDDFKSCFKDNTIYEVDRSGTWSKKAECLPANVVQVEPGQCIIINSRYVNVQNSGKLRFTSEDGLDYIYVDNSYKQATCKSDLFGTYCTTNDNKQYNLDESKSEVWVRAV